MKRITEQPLVRFLGNGIWRLEEPFEYHVGGEKSHDVIVVPVGFVTDFASVPRAFWSLYPPTGPWAPAAIVHDVSERPFGMSPALRFFSAPVLRRVRVAERQRALVRCRAHHVVRGDVRVLQIARRATRPSSPHSAPPSFVLTLPHSAV